MSRRMETETDIPGMFDRISKRYDLLNRLLSLGLDRWWRRHALKLADLRGGEGWLDVACGTGDMAVEGLRQQGASRWTLLDPAGEMLKRAARRERLSGCGIYQAPAEALPFADAAFDGCTVAFGLRNFADRRRGLAEMHRVLKPGGRVVILEFHPAEKGRGWGAGVLRTYLEKVLPLAGELVSGDRDAYAYLARSSAGFWPRRRLRRVLREIGFHRVHQVGWLDGAVVCTLAHKTR